MRGLCLARSPLGDISLIGGLHFFQGLCLAVLIFQGHILGISPLSEVLLKQGLCLAISPIGDISLKGGLHYSRSLFSKVTFKGCLPKVMYHLYQVNLNHGCKVQVLKVGMLVINNLPSCTVTAASAILLQHSTAAVAKL